MFIHLSFCYYFFFFQKVNLVGSSGVLVRMERVGSNGNQREFLTQGNETNGRRNMMEQNETAICSDSYCARKQTKHKNPTRQSCLGAKK
jgi:hypothetical protein